MHLSDSKKTRLIFHSGLGNQLFQWAFFRIANSNGLRISPAFVPSLTSKDRPLQLSKLMSQEFYSFTKISNLQYNSYLYLKDSFANRSFLQRIFLDYRTRPFDIPSDSEVEQASILTGYFQSFKHILEHQDLVVPFLIRYIADVTVPDESLKSSNVIHIRGGDLNNPVNFLKYGTLGLDYYQALPLDVRLPTIIVTDDRKRAESIASRIKANRIFGPNELDPWQTLKLMLNSRNLFAANSTLSLWASFLRSSQDLKSFVPNPIFRDPNFDCFDSLKVPGTYELSAKFQT